MPQNRLFVNIRAQALGGEDMAHISTEIVIDKEALPPRNTMLICCMAAYYANAITL
tara:strand:+ start:47374 stop:47541 length:168 start_codon:yes stop_codon:yes gene_type:complete